MECGRTYLHLNKLPIRWEIILVCQHKTNGSWKNTHIHGNESRRANEVFVAANKESHLTAKTIAISLARHTFHLYTALPDFF